MAAPTTLVDILEQNILVLGRPAECGMIIHLLLDSSSQEKWLQESALVRQSRCGSPIA
jgi:hypothetical protein